MSEYSGVEAAAKGNPVTKFAKKRPILAAGLVGGALLLVYLFKPKEQPAATSQPDDPAAGYYPQEGSGAAGQDMSGAIEDIYAQMETLYGAIGGMSDENAANMDALSKWVEQSMGEMSTGFGSQLEGALNDVYSQLDAIGNQAAQQPAFQAPVSYPQTGLSSLFAPYNGGYQIQRVDLNIPNQPQTLTVRQQMDQLGSQWGAIYQQTGRMDTPEQNAIHAQVESLGNSIGLSYNSQTGTYSSGGSVSTPAVSTPAVRPASGVGSNQYNYLNNLVAAGGGNGEWAKAELAAGRY
jgi:hypothetical protein